jgi:hypothetical protein
MRLSPLPADCASRPKLGAPAQTAPHEKFAALIQAIGLAFVGEHWPALNLGAIAVHFPIVFSTHGDVIMNFPRKSIGIDDQYIEFIGAGVLVGFVAYERSFDFVLSALVAIALF